VTRSIGWGALAGMAALLLSCAESSDRIPVQGRDGVEKTAASARAERRLFDGAPPVIPHDDFKMDCNACHASDGIAVPDVGLAPQSPHAVTAGMSVESRCRQCHVFALTDDDFRANTFVGLRQDLRHGARLNPLAPPTMPHKVLMRENCIACHSGQAAREEIRTPHPERTRCLQCHVPVTTTASFTP
jgi:cytochrome c-type protein NapB